MDERTIQAYEKCTDLFLALYPTNNTRKAAEDRILDEFGTLDAAAAALQSFMLAFPDGAAKTDASAKLRACQAFLDDPEEYPSWVMANKDVFLSGIFQIDLQLPQPPVLPNLEFRSTRQCPDPKELLAEALELVGAVVHLEGIPAIALEYDDSCPGFYDHHLCTVRMAPCDHEDALATAVHEIGHAIHYWLATQGRPTITRHGYTSAIKEGFAYELLRLAAEASENASFRAAAYRLLNFVWKRSAKELAAFDSDVAERMSEFIGAPGYRMCYAQGIRAVSTALEKHSLTQIGSIGLVSLREFRDLTR